MSFRSRSEHHEDGTDRYWKSTHLATFTTNQLIDIAVKRSLESSGLNKPQLVRLIQNDVDNELFLPFFGLPAELRNKIYDDYFKDFDTHYGALTTPAQPPLTMACRDLRAEVLPRFYTENRFNINMDHLPQLTLQRAIDKKSWDWLHRLQQADLALIRHLRVSILGFAIDLDFGAVAKAGAEIHDLWGRNIQIPDAAKTIVDTACRGMKQQGNLLADFDGLLESALLCYHKIESSRSGIGGGQ